MISHTDILLFLGLLFGGESILLPALYTATIGHYSILKLVIIAMLATVISDSVWYLIGRYIPIEKLKAIKLFAKHAETFNRLSNAVKRHGLIFLFFSKYIYGTRIVMQLACGIEKIRFISYIIVNTLGVLSWLAFLYALSYVLKQSLESLKVTALAVQIGLAVGLVLFLLVSVWISKKYRKLWFQ